MPIALNKVQKHIRKKKGALNSLGERDVKRIARAAGRDKKLTEHARLRNQVRENDYIRYGFLKVAVKDATEPLTMEIMRELIRTWVHRDDHELEEMEKARRPGRPPASKYLLLKNRIEREVEEFRTGYRVPDLTKMENVEMMQAWDGKMGGLSQVSFCFVTMEPLENEGVREEDKMEA